MLISYKNFRAFRRFFESKIKKLNRREWGLKLLKKISKYRDITVFVIALLTIDGEISDTPPPEPPEVGMSSWVMSGGLRKVSVTPRPGDMRFVVSMVTKTMVCFERSSTAIENKRRDSPPGDGMSSGVMSSGLSKVSVTPRPEDMRFVMSMVTKLWFASSVARRLLKIKEGMGVG